MMKLWLVSDEVSVGFGVFRLGPWALGPKSFIEKGNLGWYGVCYVCYWNKFGVGG